MRIDLGSFLLVILMTSRPASCRVVKIDLFERNVDFGEIHSIKNDKSSNSIYFRPAEPLNPSEFDEADKLTDAELEPPTKIPVSRIEHPSRVEEYQTKNGLLDKTRRWPMAIVPYVIADEFDGHWRKLFARSFKEFHKFTCVRFTPRKNQKDYIVLVNGTGCDSDAGRIGGEQTVALGPGCFSLSTVVHELVHALGFWHEQNRYDRDDYIKIHWENIIEDMKFNFDKLSSDDVTDFGVPYDTDSIMHYDQWAFSIDYGHLAVMTPYKPNPKMGLAEHFSKSDIKKINRMYGCNSDLAKPSGEVIPMPKSLQDSSDVTCSDFHQNCTEFASRGDCTTNSLWMSVNCRHSCNKCDTVCEDSHPECENWAQSSKCETDREYMTLYCAKSCKVCEDTE